MMKFSHDILISLIHHHRPDLGGPIEVEPIGTSKFNRSFWVRAAGEESLVPIAAQNRTALDSVLSRLLLAAQPTDAEMLSMLAEA